MNAKEEPAGLAAAELSLSLGEAVCTLRFWLMAGTMFAVSDPLCSVLCAVRCVRTVACNEMHCSSNEMHVTRCFMWLHRVWAQGWFCSTT